ncbi:MAG: ribosome maturation factor RimM [Pseudonocardia sp.]
MSSTPTAELLVGIVGRPHGLRGEVAVTVRTDSPEERFAPGAVLRARGDDAPEQLTVLNARPHSGRFLVTFAEAGDRDSAELLRGTQLLIDAAELPLSDDPDTFHDHELEGLIAELADGTVVGTVREVSHAPGADLLVIAREGRGDALVPFVAAIVPTVDTTGGRVVLTPPDGLLDD